MMNRIYRYLLLLVVLTTLFPSGTAFAQTQEIYFPTVYGYNEPQEPPVTGPSPFDVNSRDLVIFPTDLGENDYEVTQDEVAELTDELRDLGVVNGYITYMVSEEEDIRKGPFALGSFALVFMNEQQAQEYFSAVEQNLIDAGLSEYWRYRSSVVYVSRETIQGFRILYSDAIGREGNVIVYTYSVDQEGATHPSTYISRMLNTLFEIVSGANDSAESNAQDTSAEKATIPINIQWLPKAFKVIAP